MVDQSPWLTVTEAAARARCSARVVRRAVKAGKLKAATVNARGELRLLPEWIDEWLKASVPRAA